MARIWTPAEDRLALDARQQTQAGRKGLFAKLARRHGGTEAEWKRRGAKLAKRHSVAGEAMFNPYAAVNDNDPPGML